MVLRRECTPRPNRCETTYIRFWYDFCTLLRNDKSEPHQSFTKLQVQISGHVRTHIRFDAHGISFSFLLLSPRPPRPLPPVFYSSFCQGLDFLTCTSFTSNFAWST
jgi:hypothetical protein